MKTLDKVLIIIGSFILLFVISMEVMYYVMGSVPDALIIGVLGSGGTECIMCALITLGKRKWKDDNTNSDDPYEENGEDTI